MSAHPATTAAWLRWVHGRALEAGVPGVVAISWLVDDAWRSAFYDLADIDDAAACAAEMNDAGRNLYYRTHLLAEKLDTYKRGTSEQTRWVTHLAADVDIAGPGHKRTAELPPSVDEAVRIIDATLAPSAILSSGGGLYPVWRLDTPHELTDADGRESLRSLGRRVDAALASHGYHVDATVLDLTRVIRPPGVVNHKHGRDPRPVTVLRGWAAGAADYSLADLDVMLPRPHVAERRPKPSGAAGHRSVQTDSRYVSVGDTAPWVIFARDNTLADVLAADPVDTWEQVKDQQRMEAWRYVGSSSAYSLKLSPSGVVIVQSATIAARLGIDPGSGVDLWGLACRLAGLDPTEAARKAVAA